MKMVEDIEELYEKHEFDVENFSAEEMEKMTYEERHLTIKLKMKTEYVNRVIRQWAKLKVKRDMYKE